MGIKDVWHKINKDNWDRKEYFDHYFYENPCTYNVTVKIDITNLKNKSYRLYPVMLYCITTLLNRHAEFRYSIDDDGVIGIYDEMIPCYTVFHKDDNTFSDIYTKYSSNYKEFLAAYEKDVCDYGNKKGMFPKPDMPKNGIPVSMIPWLSFESFDLSAKKGYDYLTPIFTMGKYSEENGKFVLPFSVRVHHAVCDGFHLSRFIGELQEFINEL